MAKQTTEKRAATTGGAKGTATQQDPICGRRLLTTPAGYSAEYKKRRYYFCSARCKDEFKARTEKFKLVEQARAGVLFTPGKVRWALG